MSEGIDPQLKRIATLREIEYLEAKLEHGSVRGAARALGVHRTTIKKALDRLERRAATRGYSPEEDANGTTPEGYHVKGKSILYNAAGDVVQYWLKTNKDAVKLEDVAREILAALDIPNIKPAPLPLHSSYLEDLISVYPIGDAHVGMYASAEETGKEFDVDIVRRELLAVADKLVSLAPATKRAVIVNVGDFIHMDNKHNRTENGNNPLDPSTVWTNMIKVGIACAKGLVQAALRKHDSVDLFNVPGNHDSMAAFMLSLILAEHYKDEPRVKVHDEPKHIFYLRFGKCLFGMNHGDMIKPQDLLPMMSVDRAQDWGETKFRYWWTGHVHHDQRKEYMGGLVESFRTLASNDRWHHNKGYRSGSDMKCIVYDKNHGEVLRHTVGLSQIG